MWSPSKSLVWRLSIFILCGTGLVLAMVLLFSGIAQSRQLVRQQQELGEALTVAAVNRISELLGRVESSARSAAICIKTDWRDKELSARRLKDLLLAQPEIHGITVATAKGIEDAPFASLSVFRQNGKVVTRAAMENSAQYIEDWYYLPEHLMREVWSEPSYEAQSKSTTVTFSVPVMGPDRELIAVVACDLTLEGIREMLDKLPLGESGMAVLLSARGVYISHPVRDFEMRETIYSVAEALGGAAPLRPLVELGEVFSSGKPGMTLYRRAQNDTPTYIHYRSVPQTHWTMYVAIPEGQVLAPLRAQNKMNVLIGLVGGVLLLGASIVVAFSLTRPLHELAAAAGRLATGDFETPLPSVRRGDEIGRLTSSFARMREELHSYIEELTTTTAAKEKIASELAIAHQIQLGIVPKLFPPFPERGDLDLFATLVPAREVGGDLYDFTLLDEDHLYVAIGDVSGKGVPASLLMAVGKTLLKSTIQAVRDPARAMTMVNDELSADNESCMFITAFCAILNLHTGQLTFANAGHNPPIIVSKDGTTRFIQRKPGPALGVMPAVRYVNKDMTLENDDMLLLYTDGVTEAMNDKSELFGEERMARIASDNAKASAQKLIKAMVDSISTHAHGVEQSDDITMLAVRSTAQKALRAPDAPERAPDAKILLGNHHEGLEHMVSWLERSAETLGIPPETVMALNLALEEWFVNIISYAYSDSAAHDVEMRMWKDDKQILVQIEDDGQPFDPCAQAAPDTQASLEQRKIGGLGIHFIRKTMDLMHYRRDNGRNILTLAKLIS